MQTVIVLVSVIISIIFFVSLIIDLKSDCHILLYPNIPSIVKSSFVMFGLGIYLLTTTIIIIDWYNYPAILSPWVGIMAVPWPRFPSPLSSDTG